MDRQQTSQAGASAVGSGSDPTTGSGFYNTPSWFRIKVYDPFIRQLLMRTRWTGFERDSLRVLAIQGRKTGRWYEHPVGVCRFEDARYLISFYGESQWARNLRAGCAAELRIRGESEPITTTELPAEDKIPLFAFIAKQYPWIVRIWWKLKPKRMTEADMQLLIQRYPVFRVVESQ